jgi:GH15 family glucan-1,4-alpha-glucosidase
LTDVPGHREEEKEMGKRSTTRPAPRVQIGPRDPGAGNTQANAAKLPSPHGRWRSLKARDVLRDYKPISDYGVIGDQRTCALVGVDGSIDWLCLPRFDSPSVFGALLDRKRGGYFRIWPDAQEFESLQRYDGPTNVLVTEFRDSSGHVRLTDFMPCFNVGRVSISTGEVHRRVSCLKGRMEVKVEVRPRPGYGSLVPKVGEQKGGGYSFFLGEGSENRQELALLTDAQFEQGRGSITRVFELREGEGADFVLRYGGLKLHDSSHPSTDVKLRETRGYWRGWARKVKYRGRWREMVVRSALALRLLVYSPTGAILAAATTSLPEKIHGERNWDYRYSWIRDSAFVLWAFHSLGIMKVEDVYLDWLTSIFYLTGGELQVMLGINGERDLTEQVLEHLEGYKGSRPVRVGNAAWSQFQLDVYGILVDALWFSHKHVGGISTRVYEYLLKPAVEIVEKQWENPDCGIWEVRGARQQFVYSKVWCWVALDRAVKIAEELGMGDDRDEWATLRAKIRASILKEGWDEDVGSFVRSYGSKQLDAANLLMPQVRFIDANDPRMRSTVDKTMEKLMTRQKFVYRYLSDDGLPGDEGAFLVCSFWLVSCLTREGRLDEAEKLLESLIECSNHLGLFSEEIDPETGAMLGNFPQAFTHMGFVTATVELGEALVRARQTKKGDGAERKGPLDRPSPDRDAEEGGERRKRAAMVDERRPR